MSFPALLDAGADPLLVRRGSVAAVYLSLLPKLDFVEFRRLKAKTHGELLEMRPETVGSALQALVDHGYLVRGPRVLEANTYRLVFSRQREIAPKR